MRFFEAGHRGNGTANKANGDVNGFVRESSDRRRTSLQMGSVQPPDVVTSQRRHDSDRHAVSSVDDDSIEVIGPVGVDNPGYAEDTGSDVVGQYNGCVTPPEYGRQLRSPTRLQYVPPSSRSPLPQVVAGGRRSVTPSSSNLPRTSPVQRPTSAPAPGPVGARRQRATPMTGLDNVYEEEPSPAAATMVTRGRVLTPTVGLTVEEVDRITDSRRCTPAAAAVCSSTSSTGRGSSPDLVNRTDFTRNDLELVARPQSTTSDDDDDDDTQDETFTCSEYDCAGRRRTGPPPMLDFANPYRLRAAPNLALPPPPVQPGRSVTPKDRITPRGVDPSSSSSSTVDETFSVDDRRRASPADVDLSRAAAQLGWSPNLDAIAEIFLDLAALTDAGRLTSVAAGRSPVGSPLRSTPQPVTSQRPASSSTARSDTPSLHARPLHRLPSPAERLGSTDGQRSSTSSSQAARRTPPDGIHRRNPSSPTSPPPYMPPPSAYDPRRLNGTSSPRDRIGSPARGSVPSTSVYAGDGRTPRPVLEEYV